MDRLVGDILEELRAGANLDAAALDRIIRRRSSEAHDGRRVFAKKRILPYYLAQRDAATDTWRSWNVEGDLDERFVRTLQMKPRRSASGVATITAITKPWPCENRCLYCPDDVRMPKSYLRDEPACQRAQRNSFHPYLQVASRLRTLQQMGHPTDKVELIVLGGTWLDYPQGYQRWFVCELFRALNDADRARRDALGQPEELVALGEQPRTLDDLRELHLINETAAHRVVGLVVETRPDTVTPRSLTDLRAFGCTKIQLGVQSIDEHILASNGRREKPSDIERAFSLCRLFGFKIHAHFMVNLFGATPQSDVSDYRKFVTDAAYQPDEVKLYPCALVASAPLVRRFEEGSWQPYAERELVDTLARNLCDTPAYTRISRMIRDISSDDIIAGNKKTNLRQLVEDAVRCDGSKVSEIRFREIGTDEVDVDALALDEVTYETSATTEHFLQWVTPKGKIAGFARLSLPRAAAHERFQGAIPLGEDEAMLREVHVYGFAAKISSDGVSAQHHGLGRALIQRACAIAADEGYAYLNVISAVGTRDYYRKLGFADNGLYQRKAL